MGIGCEKDKDALGVFRYLYSEGKSKISFFFLSYMH